MQELSIIFLLMPLGLFVVRFIVKKSDINWATFVTGICGICALLIDDTIEAQTMVIAIMPLILVTLFSALEVMGLVGGKK